MAGESINSSSSMDILKIMVATDCHLGYQEDDPNIGPDSFVTFEEILAMAVEKEVDMILLGGDLFHHNNPTQQTLNKCMSLLRQYTMGDRPVYLELLSDAPIVQSEGNASVNYLDKNLNISIPVFSIHGNHDDPSGVGLCSSMDTLSSAGLVNYFGKWTDLSDIKIKPILLKKGSTALALYGLSHIKDERLSRLFLEEKVAMVRPKETPEDWFNIFILHQNRVDRGPKRFISDSYLPGFLDLVIWGHEHDCDIIPSKNVDKGFYVTQPGSSVPTSLSEGETKPKHVGFLEIRGRKFKWTPLRLQTTRPFIFSIMRLMDIKVSSSVREIKSEEIRAACQARVEEMIEEAKELLTGHPKQPTLPLIRLRCDFTNDTQLFNLVKFGQLFYKRVANPDSEVIRLKKIVDVRDKGDLTDAKADLARLRELNEEAPETFSSCVESIVEEYFETFADKRLLILSVKGMACGVERFIEKKDSGAIEDVCLHQRKATLRKMLELDITEDNVMEHLEHLRDERSTNAQEQEQELMRMFKSKVGSSGAIESRESSPDSLGSDPREDDPQQYPDPVPPKKNSRAAKTSLAFSRSNTSHNNTTRDNDDYLDPPPPRGRGRGRASRGGRASTTTSRARGTRASRARGREMPTLDSFFPPTPTRATPVRAAAVNCSQTISSIQYYDDDSD